MNRKVFGIIQALTVLVGMGYLINTNAYYQPYLVVLVFALFAYTKVKEYHYKWHLFVAPMIYGLAVMAANYTIWSGFSYPDEIGVSGRFLHSACMFLGIFVGAYFQAFNICQYLYDRALAAADRKGALEGESIALFRTSGWKPWQVFLIPFLSIVAIDNIILFTCRYPGTVSSDSLTQIKMFMEGWYNNHHPFYHTQVIRLFVSLGLKLFGDLNAAVAFFNVFQIFFMAACFSAAVMTIWQVSAKRSYFILLAVFYAVMPFHINYSFAVWKDVWFGGFVLLFCIYFFRTMHSIGLQKLNYVFLTIGALGICLFRSNGYVMFLVVAVVYLFLFRKNIFAGKDKVIFMFVAVLISSFILKHPVLKALDVSQPDTVEMLSIPLQQISRTAVEYDDFSEEDLELINDVISIDRMREVYHPQYSDPEKDLIRAEGNQLTIRDNKLEYAFLYIRVGLKHPNTYLKAWVDQTCGYWNSGYNYWRWLDDVTSEEGYDLFRTVNSEFAARHFYEYQWMYENNPVLILFLCIGFYVWIDWLLLYLAAVNGDKAGVVMAMPVIALVFTLQISSPVYSEFRYVYSIFCTVPFLLAAIINNKKTL